MKCRWHLCKKDAVKNGVYCSKKCKNKYNVTLFTHKRKKTLVDYAGGKCKICGYNKCLAALTFHHRNPLEKSFGLAENVCRSKTIDDLKKEVDKCDLLCSNCHHEEHYMVL